MRQPTFVRSLTVLELPVLLQWRGYLIHSMWFLILIKPSVNWSLERSSIMFSSYPISNVPNLASSLTSLHIDSFKFSPGISSFSSKLAIDIISLRSGFPNISSLNPASLWNSLDSLRFWILISLSSIFVSSWITRSGMRLGRTVVERLIPVLSIFEYYFFRFGLFCTVFRREKNDFLVGILLVSQRPKLLLVLLVVALIALDWIVSSLRNCFYPVVRTD